jgi:hypothetical protein
MWRRKQNTGEPLSYSIKHRGATDGRSRIFSWHLPQLRRWAVANAARWTTYQRAVKALTPKEQAAIPGRVQGGQSYEELRRTLRVATAGASDLAVTCLP